ncbi:MAG: DUF438 domain-containing protein [Anaerolineae bacterium]|jgi:DUF438 domain-containing protein|nr:DUF438 domain-containing protein [Anaerolineae bacterium]
MSEFIDNVSKRKQMLKEALAGLHEGRSVEEVQEIFAELVKVATYDDIAEAEQMLIAEGLPAAEIQKLCDLHVAVVRDALDAQPNPESLSGHPVHTMRAENEIAGTMLQQMAGLLTVPGPDSMALVKERLEQLINYEKHYLRKENLLFPFLERYAFTGPSQVMWGIHDEVRKDWKALAAALENLEDVKDWTVKLKEVRSIFLPMQQKMTEMIYKEEKILIPASLERLSEEDWSEIYQQEANLGYFVVRPGTDWQPVVKKPTASPAPKSSASPGFTPGVSASIHLNTGILTPEQLDLMLTSVPFDITFVDENDEVRYFTQGKERIFPREAAIIGRKVQLCHPPQSMDKVQRILDDFRAGVRDVAEFWIQMGKLFVHIRYYALRDTAGGYKGCIEVSQDIAPLRTLEGEKRLLDD